jgi:exopolysaccharide biosynthesis protein
MIAEVETLARKAKKERGDARRRIVLLLAIAAIVPLFVIGNRTLFARQPIEIAGVKRSPLAEGVELVEANLLRGETPGGRFVGLYIDPKAVSLELMLNDAQETLSNMAPDALAVLNAGFFTKERKPTGLLVSSGKVLSPLSPHAGGAGSGVFIVENDAPTLIERDQAVALLTKKSFPTTTFAIQAGPRIIEPNGLDGIVKDDGAHANRTVIGANAAGEVIIAVILGPSGWPSGPTLYEVQHLLGAKGLGAISSDLAFSFALNLDGGPSTGLHVRAKTHPIDEPESAPVHSVLLLRTKP